MYSDCTERNHKCWEQEEVVMASRLLHVCCGWNGKCPAMDSGKESQSSFLFYMGLIVPLLFGIEHVEVEYFWEFTFIRHCIGT